MAGNQELLRHIPVVKRVQLSLEGLSLDAASMVDMEPKKRYTVALALIERQRDARSTREPIESA